MAHTDVGVQMMERFEAECKEFGTVEKRPILEGRFLTMFVLPLKNK